MSEGGPCPYTLPGQWGCQAVTQQPQAHPGLISACSVFATLSSESREFPVPVKQHRGVLRFHQQVAPILLSSFLCSSASPLLFLLLFPPQVSDAMALFMEKQQGNKLSMSFSRQCIMNSLSQETKAPLDSSRDLAFFQSMCLYAEMCISW